jgi:hypothetical protein
MKQIKNATLAVLGGLLILSVATVSCSKKSSSSSMATPTIGSIAPSASDTVGQVITITGTNFTSASTVTIGGIAATPVTFTSSTSISVTIPSGVAAATAVPVIVTTGTSASTASNITVVLGVGAFVTADGKNSSNEVEASFIIGHWTFDGTNTEAISGMAPVLSGGTTSYVTGRIGQAIHLADAWLTYPAGATYAGSNNTGASPIGSNDTLQNGATITLWAQVDTTTVLLGSLFQLSAPLAGTANWPIFGIQYYRAADSAFSLNGGLTNIDAITTRPTYAGSFGPSVKDSLTWAFVAMAYDTTGGTKHFDYYFNGTLRGTASVASSFPTPEALLMVAPNYASIGCAEGQNYTPNSTNTPASYMSYGINANIDDVRFFNTTLTATDISDLFQLGNHGQ